MIPDLLGGMEFARDELYRMLDMVPDNRLDFSVGGNAKSPLEIMKHVAGVEDWVVKVVTDGDAPFPPREVAAECSDTESLRERLDEVRSNTVAALKTIEPGKLAEIKQMPWGEELSVADLLRYLAFHDAWHAGQLAYIQTILGIEGF